MCIHFSVPLFRSALLLVALFGLLPANAQLSRTSLWYFGFEAAMDFRSGRAVALAGSAMRAQEGSAVATDTAGNLQFYTNGVTIWDKQHQLMPGSANLLGNEPATQPALVVPKPHAGSSYYVFLVDAQAGAVNSGCGCLSYVEVDMAARNGLGRVLARPQNLFRLTTEKVAAVRHANGRDVWVLGHEWATDAFHAYLISPDSISKQPVISRVGSVHTDGARTQYPAVNAVGQMKFSPDGRRLALAVYDSSFVEVFDFDRTTGQVRNPIKLDRDIADPDGTRGCYGVEFSPDGRKLYVSRVTSPDDDASDLTQFNLAVRPDQVAGTAVLLPGIGRALQLAPDGRIYAAQALSFTLNAILAPNLAGRDCRVTRDVVRLSGRGISTYGLPCFMVDAPLLTDLEPETEAVTVKMPNIFTPNTDGFNDTFAPEAWSGIAEAELRIYSRWGQLLFTTTDPLIGWSGADAPAGTYFYELRFTDNAHQSGQHKGWLELMR